MTTIVLIEDDELLCSHLVDLLQFEGYSTYEAARGMEGIELIRSTEPDLVICDIALPQINGFDVIELMRQSETMAEIPVLLVTARKNARVMERATRMGIAPPLFKPFTFETLLDAIKHQIDAPE